MCASTLSDPRLKGATSLATKKHKVFFCRIQITVKSARVTKVIPFARNMLLMSYVQFSAKRLREPTSWLPLATQSSLNLLADYCIYFLSQDFPQYVISSTWLLFGQEELFTMY